MSVFNTSRLVGKNVLITGASSGIGAVSIFTRHFFRKICAYQYILQGDCFALCEGMLRQRLSYKPMIYVTAYRPVRT
jgi:hypothetical protein